ncbi:MAG: hypothetical protein ACOYLO_00330 [Ferruginibacter sp.]
MNISNKPFAIIYPNGHKRYFKEELLKNYFGKEGIVIDGHVRLHPIGNQGKFINNSRISDHIVTEILDDGEHINIWVEEAILEGMPF